MKILESVYNSILNDTPSPPPESGGILGGADGVITCYAPDKGISSNGYDQYVPDVEFLNAQIEEWKSQGVAFYGIYHTHFPGGDELSTGDKEYVRKIMSFNRQAQIYFPIVIPGEKMVCYCAETVSRQPIILKQAVEIIKNRRKNQ